MNSEEIRLLKKIGNLPLVSGFEDKFNDELKEIAEDYLGAEMIKIGDNLVYLPKKTENIFVAHYDEVGFVVDNQYHPRLYRTIPMGLIDWNMGYGKIFQTKIDDKLIYAIGSNPIPHEDPDEKRLFLELLEEHEIPALWPFTYENRIKKNKDHVYSKALDDRAGVIALLSVAKHRDIAFILSHGEEQGTTRYGETLKYIKKKNGGANYIIVDSIPCREDEHVKSNNREHELGIIPVEGKGVGNIASKKLVEYLIKISKNELITIETNSRYEVTDATTLYRLGEKAIAIGYPLKYLHSSFEVLNRNTFLKLKRLIGKIS